MKIVVVSDSHSNLSVLNDIVMQNYDGDYFFHLGDSELPQYLLNNFACVRGNNDFNDLPKERDMVIEGFKIHMEHGNNFNFMMNPDKYIKNKNCDIFLFGHTHKRLATKVYNTYVFNPGSVTRPRDNEYGTYLILTLINGKEIKYEFKTLNEED